MRERFFAQPSVMTAQQHFSKVPNADIQRSSFDRSHGHLTTFDAGELVPIYLDEVLPGDTFHMDMTAFLRLATPLHPIMDNMYADVHFWFVPTRLVWNEFVEFMGERKNPNDNPDDISPPFMNWTPPDSFSGTRTVLEYFGLPMRRDATTNGTQVSALPGRCYRLIWNEWYRDQNLQDPLPLNLGSNFNGDDVNLNCVRRGKRHDYFTSCLPWPQKGDPVSIPLAGNADVYGRAPVYGNTEPSIFAIRPDSNTNPALGVGVFGSGSQSGSLDYDLTGDGHSWEQSENENLAFNPFWPIGRAELDDVTAVTINQLRTAFQIQKLLERDARGGTRYIEIILSHFGVRSDDARLQRPEYLGGGSTRINITPVASTVNSFTAGGDPLVPQGNLSGVGTGVLRGAKFTKSFTEHGYIVGLISVRADLRYQQGVDRMWFRKTRYDYYWPSLAHLGEQAVLNKEIFLSGDTEIDEDVFGYQERYAEYRYKKSIVTGAFNSDYITSLDSWHLAQHFESLPALNDEFIEEDPPLDRVIAVSTEPHFLCDAWFDLRCDRPMPVYSVPGLIDHF